MEGDNMPNFANPFQGNVERKLTKQELIQAVRLDIAGELEAIYLYDAHVQATDNVIAKKVISDIRGAVPEEIPPKNFILVTPNLLLN